MQRIQTDAQLSDDCNFPLAVPLWCDREKCRSAGSNSGADISAMPPVRPSAGATGPEDVAGKAPPTQAARGHGAFRYRVRWAGAARLELQDRDGITGRGDARVRPPFRGHEHSVARVVGSCVVDTVGRVAIVGVLMRAVVVRGSLVLGLWVVAAAQV